MSENNGSTETTPTIEMNRASRGASVTHARHWRRKSVEGELFVLPGSGNIARLRRPNLMAMSLQSGEVRNGISRKVVAFLSKDTSYAARRDYDELKQITDYKETSEAMLEIASLAFVEPRLIVHGEPNYDAGEIGPDDITDHDLAWVVYKFVEGPAEGVAEFRVPEGAGAD